MLIDMQDDGTLVWNCAHCGTRNQAHVSEEAIKPHRNPLYVDLAPCEACAKAGTPTIEAIKVGFTDEELVPPIVNYDSVGCIVAVQHGPHVIVHRHQVAGRVAHISHWSWEPPNLVHHVNAGKHLASVGKLAPEHVRDGLPQPIEIRPGGTP